jgi:uncharacterized protein (UPF0248 family)
MVGLQDLSLSYLRELCSYLSVTDLLKCSALSQSLRDKVGVLLRRLMYSLGWELETTEPPVSVFIETYFKRVSFSDFRVQHSFKQASAVQKISSNSDYSAVLTHAGEVYLISADFSRWVKYPCSYATHVSASQELLAIKSSDDSLTLLEYRQDQTLAVKSMTSHEDVRCLVCTSRVLFGTSQGEVYSWAGVDKQVILMSPENTSAIVDIKAGTSFAVILTAAGQVYNLNNDSPTATLVKELKKYISRIAVVSCHCVVLQRKELEPIESWSTEQLSEWLEEQGFGDLKPLVKNSHLAGTDIENSEQYMMDTLGIMKTDQRWRMKTLLDQAAVGFVGSEYELLGWGLSTQGQLGIRRKLLKQPTKLPRLPLAENESVSDIACTTKNTIVTTSQSRVFGLGVCSGETWVELTEQFLNPLLFKIYSVSSGYNSVSLVIGPRRRTQVHHKRLKGADKVLARLQWDPALNSEEFVLGFEDRFIGVIELPVKEFLPREIPSHRIRYFKRNGELVWDRSTRLDII